MPDILSNHYLYYDLIIVQLTKHETYNIQSHVIFHTIKLLEKDKFILRSYYEI